MKLIQRVGYYLGGFSIGLIILAFFLNGKRVSCDYGPEARVKKNINSKTIIYSRQLSNLLSKNNLDSTAVNDILINGNVNFSLSNTKSKPCKTYVIEGDINTKTIGVTVENCDSIATIMSLKWID